MESMIKKKIRQFLYSRHENKYKFHKAKRKTLVHADNFLRKPKSRIQRDSEELQSNGLIIQT